MTNTDDEQFVRDWSEANDINRNIDSVAVETNETQQVTIDFAPPRSGITELVHGDIHLSENGNLVIDEAIETLLAAGVPFIQCPVSIEEDTRSVQKFLRAEGFQSFQVTPRFGDRPAQLWFGKINGKIPVVPTFWHGNIRENPFWSGSLAVHAERIATNWDIHKG